MPTALSSISRSRPSPAGNVLPMYRPELPLMTLSSVAGNRPSREAVFHPDTPPALFAVATVVATRYHTHRWVPWAVYGFATAVSFSRITGESHFPSDVFLAPPSATPSAAIRFCALAESVRFPTAPLQ